MQSTDSKSERTPFARAKPTKRVRFALVGVMLVAVIIVATGVILELQRLAAIDDFRTATKNLGNGMSQQTAHAIAGVDQVLVRIAASLAAAPNAASTALRSSSTHQMLADQSRSVGLLDQLVLVDDHGRVVNDAGNWPPAAVDLSGRDFFRHFRAIDEPALFVGAPALDPASGRWTFAMARRINDAHGRFAGIVVGECSLTNLEDFYRLAMPAARRALSLARRDGLILLRYPRRDDEIGAKIPEQSPWYTALAAGGGTYVAPGYFDAAVVIASVQPLKDLPLVVEASVTEADALVHWRGNIIWFVAGAAAAAAGVVILLRLFARQYWRIESSEQSLAAKNAEIEAAHRQLNETLANLSQGVCLYGSDKRLLIFNPRFCALYDLPTDSIQPGMSKEDVARLRIAQGSFSTQSFDEYVAMIDRAIDEGQPLDTVFELTNGKTIAFHFQPLPGGRWITTHDDITKRVQAEEKITFLARHDPLTRLANRTTFYERLEAALEDARRGRHFALFCLDLDGFKAVNDSLGHPIGDSVLCAVAQRLLSQVRAVDVVARLGGDEFVALVAGVSEPAQAAIVASRIVDSIHQPFEIDGRQIRIGISIGIVLATGGAGGALQLMKDGDLALYRAKHEGRGTWRFFAQDDEPGVPAPTENRPGPAASGPAITDTIKKD
jgi:diguanylate cyclase (GGDEF)-like protein